MLGSSYLVSGGNEQSRIKFLQDKWQVNFESDPDIASLSSPDSSIKIDEVREFQKLIALGATRRKEKIGIVVDSQKLTEEAQNALLKTLEEPPDNTILVMTVSNIDLLLPTIVSRCRLILLPEEKLDLPEKFRTDFERMSTSTLGEKFRFAKEIASTRDNATCFLDRSLMVIHQMVNQNEVEKVQKYVRLSRQIMEAKLKLRANCNVRLTMENLFLNW